MAFAVRDAGRKFNGLLPTTRQTEWKFNGQLARHILQARRRRLITSLPNLVSKRCSIAANKGGQISLA